jgi:hypothetical protein
MKSNLSRFPTKTAAPANAHAEAEMTTISELLGFNGSSSITPVAVEGEPMPDLDIYPGDLLIVQSDTLPMRGDAVIFKVDGELVIRRFDFGDALDGELSGTVMWVIRARRKAGVETADKPAERGELMKFPTRARRPRRVRKLCHD